MFSVNDFDETLPGPFEWDVKRLVASFAVAGRDRGFDDKQREGVNLAVGKGYREAMSGYAATRNLDLWYTRVNVDDLMAELQRVATAKERKRAEQNLAKTRTKDSLKAFAKLTEIVDGEPRIIGDPPTVTPIEDLFPADQAHKFDAFLHETFRSYRRTLPGDRRKLLERYRYAHAARKVVGVGSVGTRAFIVLLLGRDGNDPLFLQFKQAEASVLERFLGKSKFANHGQRVVEGQRLTQAASDIMLGFIKAQGVDGIKRDYYIRQLWDEKGSALVELMEPTIMTLYAKACGSELARAHARAGDAIAIASYLGTNNTFDRALAALRRVLRRPERTRLQHAHQSRKRRNNQSRDGRLARSVRKRPNPDIREKESPTMMLADTYPFLNIMWSMFIFFVLVMWVGFVIYILIDNFRRHDHSGWAKAGWLIFIMFVPLIGAISYMIARPAQLGEATV